jgi:hypothetical protein
VVADAEFLQDSALIKKAATGTHLVPARTPRFASRTGADFVRKLVQRQGMNQIRRKSLGLSIAAYTRQHGSKGRS